LRPYRRHAHWSASPNTTAATLAADRVTDPYSQQLLRANQGFDASSVIIDAAA